MDFATLRYISGTGSVLLKCYSDRNLKGSKQSNSPKRKILWVSPLILDLHFHKTSRIEVLRALSKLGYDTNLLAMHSRRKILNENPQVQVISIPLRYVPIISPFLYTALIFFALPFYLAMYRPDFIVIEPDMSIFGIVSIFPFSITKRVKLILDIRSTPVEIYGLRGYLKKLNFTLSVLIAKSFFDGVTIITSHMKKEICKEYDLDLEFVGVWTSGVSTELFDPKKYITDSKKLRENLGLSHRFIIFYHGAFSPNRGLIETIEAIDTVRQKYSDVVLFLLGSGSIVNSLKSLVETKKLQNNVIIHPPVKYVDVPKYIAMSDIGIVPLPNHPYWNFQCPLNLLEYLAMEKPVIITDIPANRSVIGDNRCGIYIRSIRPIEIANAIEYAYSNKGKLAEWGKLGRKNVVNKYTWDKVAEKFEEYLSSRR